MMTGITNPTEEYFKDGIWGWDGSQWRKQGILLGYHSALSLNIINSNASAGTNILETDAVEMNYLWVMETIGVANVNTAPSRLTIYVYRGGTNYPLLDTSSTVVGVYSIWNGQLVMVAGDRIRAYIYGCTAGDDLYLRVLGYKVTLA